MVNSNQAGFLVASEKGFYRDEGLDVEIRPGGMDFPSLPLVVSGSDDFGVQDGGENIIAARANGIPVKAIAVIHQDSPYVFFSLKENNITRPEDFANKRVAVSYGRPLELAYRQLMAKYGVDMSTITESKKNPDETLLFTKKIDIQPGFVSDYVFATEKGKNYGIELNVISASDFGISSYGYTIFTTDRMIEEKPEVVEKFVRASMRGWAYSVEHPEEAVDYVMKYQPTLDRESQLKAMKATSPFIVPANTTKIGWMEKSKWDAIQANMVKYGVLNKTIDVSEAYTDAFVQKV
jgi:ABC-type nitrate/sulfonate/bicarbonate transport system substrate-binding protein